jgi:hypothetical protein
MGQHFECLALHLWSIFTSISTTYHKWFICLQARQLLRELPSLVDIDIPSDRHFTVCGDVHGQYYDLLNIWKINGNPGPDNPYLFNGEASAAIAAAVARTKATGHL